MEFYAGGDSSQKDSASGDSESYSSSGLFNDSSTMTSSSVVSAYSGYWEHEDYRPIDSLPEPLLNDISSEVVMPDSKVRSVVDTIQLLKEIMPKNDNAEVYTLYENSFTLKAAAKALAAHFDICISEASVYCNALKRRGFIQRITEAHSKNQLYRLSCYKHSNVLNSYYNTGEECDDSTVGTCADPIDLTHRLLEQICRLEYETNINYRLLRKHPQFGKFEYACCELCRVDVMPMNNKARIAFGINVFNIMVKYAHIKVGVPGSAMSRKAFFQGLKFQVGKQLYSLSEWEHGFLRGNRKALSLGVRAPFGVFDSRRNAIVKQPDARMHFCLSMGTHHCPMVRPYSSGDAELEEQLQLATASFFMSEDNFMIKGNQMWVSQILLWYRSDFEVGTTASTSKFMPTLIRDWMPPQCEKREAVRDQLIQYQESIQLVPIKYEWSVRATDYGKFRQKKLQTSRKRIHF